VEDMERSFQRLRGVNRGLIPATGRYIWTRRNAKGSDLFSALIIRLSRCSREWDCNRPGAWYRRPLLLFC